MGTDFDKKTHEQMLEWLDHANSGEMQAASDRLGKAASEIRKIAEDLKIRPQWVEWKGQGADAFRTWSADLANATLRLGDYSEGVSKWLGEASNAVASAQASIPRTEAGARVNLEAALAARNDPDASDVARKSAETLIESGKRNREEAAAQMRRLSQTYMFSSSQMKSLEKPVFPAMPKAIAPQDADMRDGRQNGQISPRPAPASASSGAVHPGVSGHRAEATIDVTAPAGSVITTPHVVSPSVSKSVDMGIDGVAALPDTLPSPVANPVVPPTGPRPDSLPPLTPGMIPPVPPVGPSAPHSVGGGGRTTGLPRPSVSAPGVTPPGPGPLGREPRPNGIIGGRVVPPEAGRSAVGIPRGAVIGNESPRGTAPMGRVPGMGGGVGSGVSPITGGSSRRLAREPGGAVGGRPQQGRGSAHPFTAGGAGLARSGASEGSARKGSGARASGRDENGERPDYLVEDDETWQQGGRRVVPPVID
ncbi:hypothetical protein ACIQGT_36845 [Streptomyces sp. NPDC093108]|uniref:WXG100 family type VII secretion target n=1 Tax=Streptomyces sp. NPDC093108 TaxID=3366030 RepID=UPI0038294ACD